MIVRGESTETRDHLFLHSLPISFADLGTLICDLSWCVPPLRSDIDPYLAAPDLGPLRDRPPNEHEHLADGAALEEAKGGEVRAKAQEKRVCCGVALPLPQDSDGGEAHGDRKREKRKRWRKKTKKRRE